MYKSYNNPLPEGAHEPGHDGESYIPGEELKMAVNAALTLKMPLLLTGEPGTGKTTLAHSIAFQLKKEDPFMLDSPLVFNTKSDSKAGDLFYTYDYLRHFHDVSIRTRGFAGTKSAPAPKVDNYLTYHALGEAILRTYPKGQAGLPREFQNKEPVRAVVLIDEIDKAPRDFPNDLLNEIEGKEFTVRETRDKKTWRVEKENDKFAPIIIISSNSEKNLPDAFLRRCLFFHIEPPDADALLKILRLRMGFEKDYAREGLSSLAQHFVELRDTKGLRKKPTTAEFLSWVHFLFRKGFNPKIVFQHQLDFPQIRKESMVILGKCDEDQKLLQK